MHGIEIRELRGDDAEILGAAFRSIGCLGVGLHAGYGAAQRMYVQRGDLPDGKGIHHRDRALAEGETIVNDDDLLLYFTKRLR
jgi:hypothetical protein